MPIGVSYTLHLIMRQWAIQVFDKRFRRRFGPKVALTFAGG
jgi:hypothetical protein